MRRTRQDTPARRAVLVVGWARGAVAGVAGVAALVTAVLAWRYAGDARAGRADRQLTDLVDDRVDLARSASRVLSEIGGPAHTAVALTLLAVLALALRGRRGLALVVLGPPSAMVTTSLMLKPLIDRTRGDELAFPSGHTTSVASMAVACAVLVLGLAWLPRVLRLVAVLGLAVLVLGVGTALVARDVHYPTDTVGAVGVALAVVLTVALAIDAVADLAAPPPRDDEPTEVLVRAGVSPGRGRAPGPGAG